MCSNTVNWLSKCCLCLRDVLKARFTGEMIETDRGMGRTLRPLQHIISVALIRLSLSLNQPP